MSNVFKASLIFVDEIIVVHDGECADRTLEIAKKYTDKIFVREHVGMMEGHLVFAYEQATSDWILRIDADEFLDAKDFPTIKTALADETVGGIICKWEMFDGTKPVYFKGLEKMCFIRPKHFHYLGIPHENGYTDLKVTHLDVTLHHRPAYNNIAWSNFLRKSKRWLPVHASYFTENATFACFHETSETWLKRVETVSKHPLYYIVVEPLKMFLGQLKNGLWMSSAGLTVAMQQYYYYFSLYLLLWKMRK